MAKKFELQSANYVEVKGLAASDLVAGDFSAQANVNGFALIDVANGALFSAIVKAEKVRVEKATGEAWASGDVVYWDSVAGNVTTTLTANVLIGYAYEAAALADVHGTIVFDGSLAFAKA